MLPFPRIPSLFPVDSVTRPSYRHHATAALMMMVTTSLAASCYESFPAPATAPPEISVRTGSGITAGDFPAIFDPALWDIDPQIGNTITGTAFDFDGGRRTGILQLFLGITQNLDAFIAQQEAQAGTPELKVAGAVTTLTRTAPQAKLTQTLGAVNGQTVHTGSVVANGRTIVSFTHNVDTGAFDGEYASPADRNTPHRIVMAPLKNGTFVGGSAYDVNDDGRATYTHIGLFDKALKPLKLLVFVQADGNFADVSKNLADQVEAVVDGKDIGAAPPEMGAPPAAPPVGAPPAPPPVVVAPPAAPPNNNNNNGRFPPLTDVRFFQLDLASQGSPGNSGNIFALVNAIGRNAVDEVQRFADSARVTIERDGQGRQVEVRTGPGFESRQTFERNVQEGVAIINGKKRFQFTRNHQTGAFEGVIIAPSFDANAPLAAIVTPKGGGNSSHLIIEDIANNQKNDYRGELVVDSKTLAPKAFTFFEQYQGGLAAQPESAALVRKFGFAGIIAGF
jgi:hypothetical protein